MDDEKEFAESLSERRELPYLKAGVAYNGEQALKAVKAEKPDVMVLELRMPGIDGIRTLKLIRRLCPEQVCVLITGYRIEDCLQELEELGPNAVLHKPLKNDELVQAIDGACGGVTIPS